jgi:polygalacturonase
VSTLSVVWPADGSKNWGQQVDANLNAIVSQINAHDAAISSLGSSSGAVQGPPGPVPMRFYTGSAWPDRPVGTETSPIIDVSTAYPGAPAPTNSVEGDTWFPAGSLGPSGPPATGGTAPFMLNVRDYGATGDGATVDRSAIQAAINAANAVYTATGSVQTVYFPAGTYLVDQVSYTKVDGTVFGATSLMLLDGVCLDGVGTIKVKAGAYGSGAFYGAIRSKSSGITNATIRNITIDGNRANQTASSQCSNILLEALANIEVTNVASINANGNGIMVRGSTGTAATNIRIAGSFVSNASSIGIQSSQFNGLEIDNNTVENCTNNAIDIYGEDGDVTSHGVNFRVSNNRVRNGLVGIFLETVAAGIVTGNLVRDCTSIGLSVNRINGQPREINIVANTFSANPTAVRVTGDTGGISIRNNLIAGVTTAGVTLGSGGGNVSYVYILDNTIDSQTLNAVPLVLVTGNQAAFNRHRGTMTQNTDRTKDTVVTATTPVSNAFTAANT